MDWTELVVETTNEAIDAVTNILMENEAGGVQIDDDDLNDVRIITYFPANVNVAEKVPELEMQIKGLSQFGIDPGKAAVKLSDVNDDSWRDVWKKYYHPVRITRYLTIVPSWEDYQPENADEKMIRLDPGRAFGTGTHPTTRLALLALEKEIRGSESMIDVGTGSGVLSIAAKYLGAGEIDAYDIDDEAIKATKENVALNPIAKDINIGTNSLLDGISKKVNLIVANILAEIIVPLIPQAKECLNPGGKFITSGIINDKKDLIVNELTKHGFVIDEILNQKDWYSIIAHLPNEGE
ncbi:50S ribosomal protein L11 methyltransferase [Ligilactobacillus aviarius]|uniref:50S ribosomal protein L11 methyltransferase n=1 Tax=Ligilactobacillus aviarius TaxID=1606 RepID=UPI00249EE835|nr:50S ribosomal protein L11 methyltransferase [Ligilactobacillus aviarius]